MIDHHQLSNFIWQIADLLRGPYRPPQYERVMLPLAELLLLVLDHPDLPPHNNDMELAARRRVRKRDVSFGPQSRAGAQAWDSFQTIIATATKLGVRVYAYFLGRLRTPTTTPTLAARIRERACPATYLNPT